MELEEGSTFGPYRIVARIGRGGMAEVYLAQRTGPGGFARDLVIKRILPHLAADPEFVRMFVNEAAILARLTHSNIAQVYDFGRIDKDYYLAMEYVRGTSLDRLFAVVAGTGLPAALAVRVAAGIARGLDYAHRATDVHGRPLNVVHSDVSPSNVLVSFEGEVKLIDFGIARARGGRDDALRGTIKGKVRYMSPEQSRGLPLDPRTDVFSLGVLLWEALTGANLFDQDDPTDVLEAVQRRRAPKPSSCRPGVPDALDTIALRAVEKEPEDRFQRADEFAQALDMFLTEHRVPSSDQQLAELVRSRFASTLLVSLRDEPIKPRPPAAVAPATLVAVPDATKSAVSVPDTVRDPGTVRDPLPGPEPRPPTRFEMAATMIDGAPALPSPPVVPTPLPVRDEMRPSTSVIVAEPVPGARKGDSAKVASQVVVPTPARSGDSGRVGVQAVPASPSRAGDSERLQVQAVPITDARRRSGTTTGWFVSAWHTWSRGTRIALGLAGGGVLFAVALILFVALTGGPPTSSADAAASTVAAIPPPADATGAAPIGPVTSEDVATPSADAAVPTPDAAPPVELDAGPAAEVNGTVAVDATPAVDVPVDVVVADDAPGGEGGRTPEREPVPPTGRVTIDSRPWSVVRWHDRMLSETPVIDAVLPPGVQTFLMTDEGGVEHRCSLRVQPGRSVRIRFDLAQDCR